MDTDHLKLQIIMVVAPSQVHSKVIERALGNIHNTELILAEEKIQGLADVFTSKPHLLIVAFDKNNETLDFIKLVRNHASFKKLPVVAIFTEPLKLEHKLKIGLNITVRLSTPLDTNFLYQQVQKLLSKIKK